MTLGKKIKQLRLHKAISQEKLAEELNVSRSAIAKWETDGGIPELDNLLQLAKIFDVSLDELTGNMKKQMTENKSDPTTYFNFDFGSQHYDIELTGWNDGVYGVSIMNEDKDFLFYRKMVKTKQVYGVIGKKYIASFLPTKKIADEPVSISEAQSPAIPRPKRSRCRSSQEVNDSPTPFSALNYCLPALPMASMSLSYPNMAAYATMNPSTTAAATIYHTTAMALIWQ